MAREQQRTAKFIWKHRLCPDCGSPLLCGPRNGVMVAVLCEACRAEFEVCVVVDTHLERLGHADAERAKLFGPLLFQEFNHDE